MKLVGLGIDLCKISRIQRLLDSPTSKRFLNWTLHPDELQAEINDQYVASRWAVKEAFVKAAGQPLIFKEIKVEKEATGRPTLHWTGSNVARLAHLKDLQAHMSLSHEVDYAVAVVVLMSAFS